MAYIFYNPNPSNKLVGDCVIRALTKALNSDWTKVYVELMVEGIKMSDMPSANSVWGSYLKSKGFERKAIPNECPDCYSIDHFSIDHNIGTYVVATGSHVVTVVDGDYYDTWDSGDEVPMYYFERRL